jgi:hypothetical protein
MMGIKEFFGITPVGSVRGEEAIRSELGEAQKAYTEAVETQPAKFCRPFADKVKALRQELCDALSVGAKVCPDCGSKPIGLRHIHVVVATNRRVFTYEVGCIKCKNHRAQGSSVTEAVSEWNVGKYLPARG